jgi:hypothetical protein
MSWLPIAFELDDEVSQVSARGCAVKPQAATVEFNVYVYLRWLFRAALLIGNLIENECIMQQV